ncbi:tetratricopeptide repeat protein [bacterium]|nr:tetratricopeptide repeat protein [bacterium]
MYWVKRFVGLMVLVSLFTVFAIAGAQTTKVEYESKIAQLTSRLQELVDKMTQASEQRNNDAYETAKTEYETVKLEVTKLKEEYAAKGSKDAQGKKYYNDGRRAFQTRQFERAISLFDQSIGLLPDFAKAYVLKGYALRRMRKYPEAEVSLIKAIELDPSDYLPHSYLGGVYKAISRNDDAIAQYKLGLKKDSTQYTLHYQIARIHAGEKDWKKATVAFEQAVEINPQYSNGLIGLGHAYTEQSKFNKAIDRLRTATTLDAKNGMAWYRFSDALIKSGKYQETITAGKNALQNIGRNRNIKAPVNINIGQAYENLGDKANALKYYTDAKKDRRYTQWANWAIEKLKKQ